MLPDRFKPKFHVDGSGCWVWRASTRNGYGAYYHDGRMRCAHRVAYEVIVGPVPAGLELDHTCRNRACVNPAHLEPVTSSENKHRSPLVRREQARLVASAGAASQPAVVGRHGAWPVGLRPAVGVAGGVRRRDGRGRPVRPVAVVTSGRGDPPATPRRRRGMKTTQYLRQERAIAAADRGGIRERWLWGLRLLRDPDAFAKGSSQLKPGRADELIKAAKARGYKLSEREIRYRLQCARAYPTEPQIRHACAESEDWSDLRSAGFPAYDTSDGEPPADHRTDAEREHDHARALLDLVGEQGTLFPLRDFEPVTTTLKELKDYTEQMAELTARFAKRDGERQTYLDRLIEAAGNDMSMTWQQASDRLGADDELAEAAS